MSTYRIRFETTSRIYYFQEVEIEAASEDEARDKAEDMIIEGIATDW